MHFGDIVSVACIHKRAQGARTKHVFHCEGEYDRGKDVVHTHTYGNKYDKVAKYFSLIFPP